MKARNVCIVALKRQRIPGGICLVALKRQWIPGGWGFGDGFPPPPPPQAQKKGALSFFFFLDRNSCKIKDFKT